MTPDHGHLTIERTPNVLGVVKGSLATTDSFIHGSESPERAFEVAQTCRKSLQTLCTSLSVLMFSLAWLAQRSCLQDSEMIESKMKKSKKKDLIILYLE